MEGITLDSIKKLALECGFTAVAELNADTVALRDEVRAACEENKCLQYGTNWACPPACGDLGECEKRLKSYKRGLLLQTTGNLEDNFDMEGMMEAAKKHGESFDKFGDELRKLYPNSLILGAGPCMRCQKCTYPDEACRFPEKQISSMEAYGMLVSDVCKDCGIPYYYGPQTLTYSGCALFE